MTAFGTTLLSISKVDIVECLCYMITTCDNMDNHNTRALDNCCVFTGYPLSRGATVTMFAIRIVLVNLVCIQTETLKHLHAQTASLVV